MENKDTLKCKKLKRFEIWQKYAHMTNLPTRAVEDYDVYDTYTS